MYSEGANRFITIDYLYFDITYVARYFPDTNSLQTADLSHCGMISVHILDKLLRPLHLTNGMSLFKWMRYMSNRGSPRNLAARGEGLINGS